MENARREMEERILAEAEAFLETHGLAGHVNTFLESEEAKQRIHLSYSELVDRITELKQNTPKELSERAEELYKLFTENEEAFSKDAAANLKIKLHTIFELLPKTVFNSLAADGHLQKAFAEGKNALGMDLSEIAQDMKEKHINTFMEMLYEDYVPEGIPEEAIDFIKLLCGGGPLIPFTVIVPDFGVDDESSESEE